MKAELPQRNIQPFAGDPLAYPTFISAFNYAIEQKTTNNQDRLYYLEQYTVGDANNLVRSCLHMSHETGYVEAKRLLERKYGNKHRIAEAYLTKIQQWPILKGDNSTGLHDLSLFLIECKNTLTSMGYIAELDSTANIKMLVSKLPYGMRDRWRRIAYDIEEERGRVVKFSDLINYVEKQARIVTNPSYGKISNGNEHSDSRANSESKRHGSRYRGTSMATNTKSDKSGEIKKSTENKDQPNEYMQSPCIFCNGKSHAVETCFTLAKKSIEDRLKYFRDLGVCFGCLKKATHRRKDCTCKLTCKKCKRKHPTILHADQEVYTSSTSTTNNDGNGEMTQSIISTCRRTGAGDSSSPCIIPVIVQSKATGLAVETFAYLDNGSDAVFCTDKLKHQLNANGHSAEIELQTMTDEKTVNTTILHGLEVCDMERKNIIPLPTVYSQKQIPADIRDVVTQEKISQFPYLKPVRLNHLQGNAHIGILIGNNVPKATEPLQVINSQRDGPYACRTPIGWVVYGVNKFSKSSSGMTVNRVSIQETIERQLEDLYNNDFTERLMDDKPERSLRDIQFLTDVEDSIRLNEGHYQIGLPLQDKERRFPNNLQQAEVRAAHLKRKFSKNPTFYKDYKVVMNDTIQKGYAQKVPVEELKGTEGRKWYIPHHGVFHPRKNKLRVVYDCAASYKGFSLNKELLQGPDLTSSLVGVMLRFRQEPIAMMGDIEAMFHQVQVPKNDRDLLRFLWWPEGDIERPIEEYRMCVHLFGATSSPSCANYALRKTAEDAGPRYSQEVKNTFKRNFYVDDCLRSVKTEKEAVSLVTDLQRVCKTGGFHLTKWTSNNREVLQVIPRADRAKDVKNLDLTTDPLPTERALGMLWSPERDIFSFQITIKDKPPTRRGILSIVSSVYDPLGFIAPVTLPAKEIMQDLCRQKVGWDEKIPDMHQRRWQQWISELPKLESLSVDRCFKPVDFGEIMTTQLHHFSDASQSGYGTVSYIRMVNSIGDIHCAFVMGKSRVAPLKQVSIPRLELTAATVAVRVNNMIHKELEIPINETVFWTDSMTVLRYICNESTRFHTFVANRVALIRDGSRSSQWRYVDTKRNPADDSSRGLTVENFLKSERWMKAPEFLWTKEEEWPATQAQEHQDLPEDDKEIKRIKLHALKVEEASESIDILFSHYSSWYRLRKAVAWILRVKRFLLHKSKQKDQTRPNSSKPDEQNHSSDKDEAKLQMADLQNAEKAILQYVQKKAFAQEVKILERKIPEEESVKKRGQDSHYVKKSSTIYKLDPHMQDGIIRAGGRLRRSSLPEETKHPVILPKESKITELILRDIHEIKGHSGRNHMLAHVQKKYWIIKANAAARRVINKCVVCRRQRAAVGEQKMADLPESRVTPDEAPFTRVGVDYFGPIEVKRGRSIVKRYGVVFTCLAIRAVHIEKADTLETDSCISAIRRFIARRGQVKEIRSDNGTNLVGAEKELRKQIDTWNQSEIHESLLQVNIDWIFNPPAASHFGGIWERQIRTIRKLMSSMLKEQTLTDESLQTLFCEIEAIINSRPITRVSGDAGDLEALTPNHLLQLKVKPSLPPAIAEETGPYAKRRWKQVQYMADIFWKRWSREYLLQLQERQKWLRPKANLQTGDVVLIVDGSRPRNAWQMARVTATMPDNEGLVRQVQVQTRSSTLVRPVAKLCLLLEAEEMNN